MRYLQLAVFALLLALGFRAANGPWRAASEAPATATASTAAARAPGSAPGATGTGGSDPAPAQRASAPRVVVAFRLDRDLTSGLYLGERWVSPPSYHFAQPGSQYVVQAKAQAIDARGERVDLRADWAASDPEMVALARHDSGEVTIVVRRPGESDLTVATGDGTRQLHLRAEQLDDAMEVQILQRD